MFSDFAAAITSDNVEVNRNAEEIVVLRSYHLPINATGISLEIKKAINSKGMIINKPGSCTSDGMFKFTPTIMKNIGIKKPYPNESNFSTISWSGPNNDTITPAKKAPNIFSAPTPSAKPTSRIISANTARIPI